MHNNKLLVSVVAAAVIAGGAGFWGGTQYAKQSAAVRGGGNFSGGFMRNGGGPPVGGMGGGSGARFSAGGNGGGLVSGEVLSKDNSSITLKLRNGGSRNVFFSGATQILKSAAGAASDIAVGEQVTVMGAENTDGSLTAQSIQIRPFIASSTRSR